MRALARRLTCRRCARVPAAAPVRARGTALRRRRLPLSNNFVITFTSVHTFEFGRKILCCMRSMASARAPNHARSAPPPQTRPSSPSVFPSPLCVSSDGDTRPRALRVRACPFSPRAAPLHARTSPPKRTSAPGQACQLARAHDRGRRLVRLYPKLTPQVTLLFPLPPQHTQLRESRAVPRRLRCGHPRVLRCTQAASRVLPAHAP